MKEIMIVDDDAMMRYLMMMIIKDSGMAGIEACNGKQGIERLYAHPNISYVILDLLMPEYDGYDFYRDLRKTPYFDTVKVFVISGLMESEFLAKIKEFDLDISNMAQYYQKPVSIKNLIKQLHSN